MDYMNKYVENLGLSESLIQGISIGMMILFIAVLCLAANFFVRKILMKILYKYIEKYGRGWEVVLLRRKVFSRAAYLVIPIVIGFFVKEFSGFEIIIKRGLVVYTVFVGLLIIDGLLNSIDDIYRTYEISKTKPIKGALQVLKIVIYIMGGIIIVASIMGESPLIIIGGFSALTAVLMLIFQNSILGFVAGIQLTSNDMVRIGDWIDVSKHSANGTVVDIALLTVSVQNFDDTITTVPSYALISDSFKNYRGMEESGGRRIKRSIFIDVTSISFCSDEMLEGLKKIELLTQYIDEKKVEIEEHNHLYERNPSKIASKRQLTNIGTFRFYIYNYLKNHQQIHQEKTLLVRQLNPTEKGIPLEIYAFTNTTQWERYENIQSDIFDHIFSIVEKFGLRIFQEPNGQDIKESILHLTKEKNMI